MTFTCDGCKFFKPEGWVVFASANGTPIPQGKCWQFHYYKHEAARNVCGGKLKKQSSDEG
jgi:hypothetical protein